MYINKHTPPETQKNKNDNKYWHVEYAWNRGTSTSFYSRDAQARELFLSSLHSRLLPGPKNLQHPLVVLAPRKIEHPALTHGQLGERKRRPKVERGIALRYRPHQRFLARPPRFGDVVQEPVLRNRMCRCRAIAGTTAVQSLCLSMLTTMVAAPAHVINPINPTS